MGGELEFRRAATDAGDAAALVSAMVEEMRALYDGLDLTAPGMPKAGPAEFGPPDGVFLVGYRDGEPVCGGGLKRLPDGACEIKRMYVVPQARRSGVARALLAALEEAARGLGLPDRPIGHRVAPTPRPGVLRGVGVSAGGEFQRQPGR